MPRRIFTCGILSLCALLFVFGTRQDAIASFVATESFEIHSDDGKAVFRYLLPEHPDNPTNAIKAGVYRDGELLYSTGDFRRWHPPFVVNAGQFYFSQDFLHFAHTPLILNEDSFHGTAISFHTEGKVVRSYSVNDLVRSTRKIPLTSAGIIWRDILPETYSDTSHTEEQDILRIKTIDGIIYEFDLTTGEILSRNAPIRWRLLFAIAGFYFVGILAIIIKSLHDKKTEKIQEDNTL